jgi:hypothetical protein
MNSGCTPVMPIRIVVSGQQQPMIDFCDRLKLAYDHGTLDTQIILSNGFIHGYRQHYFKFDLPSDELVFRLRWGEYYE